MNGSWEFLGEKVVNHALDHDEIILGAKEGKFSKIKLKVKRANIEFHKVIVVYGNGEKAAVELREVISAGGETRAIDLRGQDRIIKKVKFYYHTKSKTKKRAVIRLFGMH